MTNAQDPVHEVLSSAIGSVVAETADDLGLVTHARDGFLRLHAEGHALGATVVPRDESHAEVFFSFRTLSGDFEGERSDLHDLIPIAIASLARSAGVACCAMIDEANPAVPELGEIYGRYLVPAQPAGLLYSDDSKADLAKLFRTMWGAEELVWSYLWRHEPSTTPGGRWAYGVPSDWGRRVRQAARQRATDALEYERTAPTWDYFHAPRSGLTVARCIPLARLIRLAADSSGEATCHTGEGMFAREGPFRNFVARPVLSRVLKLVSRLEVQLELEERAPAVVTLEDRVVAAGEEHLVCVYADAGRGAFVRARERAAVRRAEEAGLLYGDQRFSWSPSISPRRFEALIKDLLVASGDVTWVRSAGPTYDRDRGRDLLANWVRPEPTGNVPEGASPTSTVSVVVQCKARSRTVGKSDVRDVRDTIDRHDAGGYFLAVSTELSADLVDYLERLRTRADAFVNWWTRAEVEDELRRNPEVATRYRDIVTGIPTAE
jgi:hypothetical protein